VGPRGKGTALLLVGNMAIRLVFSTVECTVCVLSKPASSSITGASRERLEHCRGARASAALRANRLAGKILQAWCGGPASNDAVRICQNSSCNSREMYRKWIPVAMSSAPVRCGLGEFRHAEQARSSDQRQPWQIRAAWRPETHIPGAGPDLNLHNAGLLSSFSRFCTKPSYRGVKRLPSCSES